MHHFVFSRSNELELENLAGRSRLNKCQARLLLWRRFNHSMDRSANAISQIGNLIAAVVEERFLGCTNAS